MLFMKIVPEREFLEKTIYSDCLTSYSFFKITNFNHFKQKTINHSLHFVQNAKSRFILLISYVQNENYFCLGFNFDL